MPPNFRLGLEEARVAMSPFAHLSLDQRRELCLDVLGDFGAQNIIERGRELIHSCLLPFGNHSHGDAKPSASINYEKMVSGCHVCGGGGWLWWIAAVQGLEGSNEASDWVRSRIGDADVNSIDELMKFLDNLVAPIQEFVTEPPVYDPKTLDKWLFVHPYLTEHRHIPVETILRLKVGYGTLRVRGDGEQFINSDRIIIPHFFEGKLYGWQSRRLFNSDGTAKYLSTPDMPKDTTLFDFDRQRKDDLFVVESPMTVMRHAHHASLTATFGASLTDRQVALLLRSKTKRIVLWFDNDSAGWNATEKVGEALMGQTVPWAVQCPYEGDPADLTDEQFEHVMTNCVVPFSLWVRPTDLIGADDEEVRQGAGAQG